MTAFTSYFDNLFMENAWNKEICSNHVSFSKHGFETEFYQIMMDNSQHCKYRVSIPLADSNYQYVTYFDSKEEAFTYIKKHI